MEKDKREGTFIPCGDAFEKMSEIDGDVLEHVSGGDSSSYPEEEGEAFHK